MAHVKCKTPLSLDGLTSLWRYEGVIRKTILAIKYKFTYDVASGLAEACVIKLWNTPITTLGRDEAILVPIPLHKSRERWRGFNQSEKIGELVAKGLGWEFSPDLLVRKIATKSQTELKKKDRKGNVRGVFAINANYPLLSTSYLLFDDVWTTGSTLKEACRALKQNGVKTVWGLTIAS